MKKCIKVMHVKREAAHGNVCGVGLILERGSPCVGIRWIAENDRSLSQRFDEIVYSGNLVNILCGKFIFMHFYQDDHGGNIFLMDSLTLFFHMGPIYVDSTRA